MSSRGFGPTVGVYFWKKYSNPRRERDELLLYDRLVVNPTSEQYGRFKEKKKRLLDVVKPFGSCALIKIPHPLIVLVNLVFLTFLFYMLVLAN